MLAVALFALTAPYIHDGSAATLEDVIAHYAAGGRTIPHRGVGHDNPNKTEHPKTDSRRSRSRGQNQNFAASCITRGSSAVVIVPKLAGPTCAAGAPTFTVFRRLKTSNRSSIARSPP